VTLSTLQNDKTADPGLRIAAASALAPYCHPKMQATPTPRYIDLQLDVPDFVHVSDAEAFLAKIALLVARGHLDIQQGQELQGLVTAWINTQYQREELQYKLSPPAERDQTITIEGGLPALPGTNITMPVLNGHAVSEQLLAAPTDVIPPDRHQCLSADTGQPVSATPGELKAQGPHPLQEHHFKSEEPGKNSPNGGGEPCA
jgi:hypothetical protein